MKFILGQKKQMTQVWKDDGTVVPVTVVKATSNTVTGLKTKAKDGYDAVQLGYGQRREKLLAKPQRQQWKDIATPRMVKEIRTEAGDIQRGAKVEVSSFQPGDVVQVSGVSKGRGFAGVVKRHHFKGGPASHGHKDNLRAPGSIGATFPQHVTKGMRMAGRMGNAKVTVKNLTIVEVKPETQELLISGAVPGPFNGLVVIQSK
jgi:large subunit ribosomal protein L3